METPVLSSACCRDRFVRGSEPIFQFSAFLVSPSQVKSLGLSIVCSFAF